MSPRVYVVKMGACGVEMNLRPFLGPNLWTKKMLTLLTKCDQMVMLCVMHYCVCVWFDCNKCKTQRPRFAAANKTKTPPTRCFGTKKKNKKMQESSAKKKKSIDI